METGPCVVRWAGACILTTTHSVQFRHQQGSKGGGGPWVRWHVQKPHHQPPEVILAPDPFCVCVKCRSQVSSPSSPSTGCSHWIIQERLNAVCREQTGTKPHLDRLPQALNQVCSGANENFITYWEKTRFFNLQDYFNFNFIKDFNFFFLSPFA